MSSKYTLIGKIIKSYGAIGQMKVSIDDIFWDDMLTSDHVFIKINGAYVPYFIENIKETHHVIIKLEEIDDPESANRLVNNDMYLTTKSIQSSTFANIQEKKGLEGYTIVDQGRIIGLIKNIEYMPPQIIAWVIVDEKKIAIPLIEAFLVRVDHENMLIHMILPDGILNL